MITPLAALAPYIAVEEASFKTETDSISLGLILLISLVIIPSTTYIGELVPLIDCVPLILTEALSPGDPLLPEIFKPGTLPLIASIGLAAGIRSNSLAETVEIAPVRSFFF